MTLKAYGAAFAVSVLTWMSFSLVMVLVSARGIALFAFRASLVCLFCCGVCNLITLFRFLRSRRIQ